MSLEQARQLFFDGLGSFERGDFAAAEIQLREAHRLAPERASVLNNLTATLLMRGKFAEAKQYARQAVQRDAKNAEAWLNLAACMNSEGDAPGALRACERALELSPDSAAAWSGHGLVMNALLRPQDAVTSFGRAIAAAPTQAGHWVNRAVTLGDLGRYDESLADFEKALALSHTPFLQGDWLRARMQVCHWEGFDAACERVVSGIERGERICIPFAALALDTTPEQQLRCARTYVDWRYHPSPPVRLPRREGRIRLGYFSRDFRDHATSHLMAGVFEQHDKKRFDLFAFDYGPPNQDAMRTRVAAAFEHFSEVRSVSDATVAQLARAADLDIAIDLCGHTGHARLGIFAQRAARLQVSFLGYPGTTGAPFVDYLIADRTVIPSGDERFYSERIARLPHSYQPNDSRRAIAPRVPTRVEAGLPVGFVFCCFNNPAKITPDVFAAWIRLLGQLPGSALWLIDHNPAATRNLRAHALLHGISAERLVFAPRAPLADHLARHKLADLFVDTLYYNAHTTASDALWAGVPVVTCLGRAFAGRVCASLLRAVGLPELVTTSLADYEALALALARDPQRLSALREKLAAQRSTAPLFDTALFTHHLEAAYDAMWQRHLAGLPPDHLAVAA